MNRTRALTMNGNRKKILFFNAKREKCDSTSPHVGLAMLAAVLKKSGYEVMIVDYQFRHTAPPPEEFVREFKPDVIGVSLYTATIKEANKILNCVSNFDIPIMVGGPHATLYYDDLSTDYRLDYIVKGEAEESIIDVVETARKEDKPRIIEVKLPDPKSLPYPDFTSFYEYENISVYPLLTSRGCPYNCSFCVVHIVSSRKWRHRNPADCIKELTEAKKILPNLEKIIMYDDNPMVRKDHIKTFLKLYCKQNIGLPLVVINARADGIDEETVALLKEARCPSIGLGVEHGHPKVFKQIGKGETLEDILRAVKLIKKHKIGLHLCFIIGLPGDSLERTKYSINLAKQLRPDHIYWNMITPFKGSKVKKWYDQYGKVFDVINHSSYVDGDFMCDEPCAESLEFSVEERKKAYLMAILETNDARLRLKDTPRLITYVTRYELYKEFLCWLPKGVYKTLRYRIVSSLSKIKNRTRKAVARAGKNRKQYRSDLKDY